MRCPKCQSKTMVVDTREFGGKTAPARVRDRLCSSPTCNHGFTTTEIVGDAAGVRRAAKNQLAACTTQLTHELHNLSKRLRFIEEELVALQE